MGDPAGAGRSGAGEARAAAVASELVARVNRLIASPRPASGYPLEWAVEAYYAGDVAGIAALSIRARRDS